jgi:hypothetical protein
MDDDMKLIIGIGLLYWIVTSKRTAVQSTPNPIAVGFNVDPMPTTTVNPTNPQPSWVTGPIIYN